MATCTTPTDRGVCGQPLDRNLACPRCDHPSSPAVAYTTVCRIIPSDYFSSAPPAVGVRAMVTDPSDGRPTQWLLSESVANRVVPQLRKWGLRVTVSAYPGSGRA